MVLAPECRSGHNRWNGRGKGRGQVWQLVRSAASATGARIIISLITSVGAEADPSPTGFGRIGITVRITSGRSSGFGVIRLSSPSRQLLLTVVSEEIVTRYGGATALDLSSGRRCGAPRLTRFPILSPFEEEHLRISGPILRSSPRITDPGTIRFTET